MKRFILLICSIALGDSILFAQIPTNGLIARYPFSNNANDVSGNNNNGTVFGATPATDRFGNTNSCYYFDGVDDYISVSASASLNSITQNGDATFSAWFKTKDNWSYPYAHLFSKNDGGTGLHYRFLIGETSSWLQIETKYINPTPNLNGDTSWIFFTGVKEDTIAKFYINGQLIYSGNWLTDFNWPLVTACPLEIGRDAHGIDEYTNGYIDDATIYNRALTMNEILTLYNEGICFQTIAVTDTLIINANITGFAPIQYSSSIKIYPNPTNDHITIDNGDISNWIGYEIKILNSLGQEVFQSGINQQIFFIDLSSWTGHGMYYVHLIDGQGNTVDIRKIILQ